MHAVSVGEECSTRLGGATNVECDETDPTSRLDVDLVVVEERDLTRVSGEHLDDQLEDRRYRLGQPELERREVAVEHRDDHGLIER